MTTTTLMPSPKQQYMSASGAPIAGGQLYTFAAGTNTPKVTYTDSAGTVPQANPIILNSRGEPANTIFWSGSYKVVLYDALGNLIYSVDNYNTDPAGIWSIFTTLLASAGSSLIGFIQAGAWSVLRTLQDKARDIFDVRDAGMVADGVTDQTAKMLTLLAALGAAGYRGPIKVPYNCKFTLSTVYAAVPVGVILEDWSSINTGQPPGYKNKFCTRYYGDNVSDDSQTIEASGHHAARNLLNMGTAGTTSATNRYASDLYSVGQNADKDFITGLQWLRSKAPGKNAWRDATVLLSDYLAAMSPKWVTNTAATIAVTYCYYGANYYIAASTGTTGATPPTHGAGTVSDGGVSWTWVGFYGGGYTLQYLDTDGAAGWQSPLGTIVHEYSTNVVAAERKIRYTYATNGDYTMRATTYGADLITFTYSLGQFNFGVKTMFGSGTADTPLHVNQLTFVAGYGMTFGASTDTSRKYSLGLSTGSNWSVYDRTDAAIRITIAGTNGHFSAGSDNLQTCGTAALRWSVVYAGTGAINTSDERSKTDIQDIDVAVLRAWAKVKFQQFKMADAVLVKGDRARWHFGVIAQRVKDAFESEGLDAFAYGLLCYDKWDAQEEIISENGDVMQHAREAGDRYGVRYEEALALECAYLRSHLKKGML